MTNLTEVVPAESDAAVSSTTGENNTYGAGDTIQVEVTFSEAMTVTGVPRRKIKMDPQWGEFWGYFGSGTGTNTLTFSYTVAEPNTSPWGIAVLRNSLELNGGRIRLMSNQAVNATLAHTGLDHNVSHKVDWRQD